MTNSIEIAGLRVAGELFTFVSDEALQGSGISERDFWHRFAAIIDDLSPENRALLAKRDDLQAAMALLRKDMTELPLSFDNFRD